MNTRLNVLQDVRVATPCSYRWDLMEGDDRVRHCPSCDLNVYNFAEMTGEEIQKLIEEKEGHLCGRLHRRRDGTILTRDCPVGVAAAIGRRGAWVAAKIGAAAVVAAGIFAFMVTGTPNNASIGMVEPFETLQRWLSPRRIAYLGGIIVAPPPGAGNVPPPAP